MIPEIDGIRAIAIGMVLFYHFFWAGSDASQWGKFALFIGHIAQWGRAGVNLFFVLSGFLITGNLLDARENPHYFADFYRRRIFRILPLYIVTLVLIYFYYPGSGAFVLLSAAFLPDYATSFGLVMVYPVLWSLAIEEQFYLFWPWLVKKIQGRSFLIFCGVICLMGPGVRALGFTINPRANQPWIWLDHFTWGATVACFLRSRFASRRNMLKLASIGFSLGALLLLIVGKKEILDRNTIQGASLQYTLLALWMVSFLLAALATSGTRVSVILGNRFLRHWGVISYSAYLLHCMIITVWDKSPLTLPIRSQLSTLETAVSRTIIGFIATFIICSLTYRFIELPFLRRGKKVSRALPIADGLNAHLYS